MCGIFGIVTHGEQQLGPILVEAGRRLTYRGYDSVGCATFYDNRPIDLRKEVGKVDEVARLLNFNEMSGNRGIIQLRWATFGEPSRINAQPHLDSDGDLVGAHDGNVVNSLELRQQFLAEGMTVRSTNDGETCVHAVERYVDRGFSLCEAVRMAYHDLAGDYSFIIGQANGDHLCAIKKGTGLVVGLAEGANCVSSDLPSILPITRKIIRIEDGEIVLLRADRVEIRRVEDGSLVEREIEHVAESMETAQKGGYSHFMLKEIYDQPRVAGELIRLLDDSPDVLAMVESMSSARNLYLVGCGSSYHAAQMGAAYLSGLAGRPAIPVLGSLFTSLYAPTLTSDDVAIFISQSGETKDVLDAEESARLKGAETMALVNVIGSTLAKVTHRCLPIASGYEICAAATKTFANQTIALLYTALQLGDVPTTGLARLPDLMEMTLETTQSQVGKIEPLLENWSELYCLGFGYTYPIALEGALKFKEITYNHCEGMLSSEFKHGSLTAVRSNYPVIFIVSPTDIPIMVSGINEVSCRGGKVIAISESGSGLKSYAHELITLPSAGALLNPLLGILPMQLLAYQLSLAYGYDPDFPRNISKTLTMD